MAHNILNIYVENNQNISDPFLYSSSKQKKRSTILSVPHPRLEQWVKDNLPNSPNSSKLFEYSISEICWTLDQTVCSIFDGQEICRFPSAFWLWWNITFQHTARAVAKSKKNIRKLFFGVVLKSNFCVKMIFTKTFCKWYIFFLKRIFLQNLFRNFFLQKSFHGITTLSIIYQKLEIRPRFIKFTTF